MTTDKTELRRERAQTERRRQRRINAIVLPLVLVAAIGIPGLIIVSWVQHQQVAALSTALDAQRQQAVQSGQTPVAPAPGAVKKNPTDPIPTPEPGERGPAGANGLSIVGARVAGCRLVLRREDGHEYDAGPVCGAKGAPGTAGSPGPGGTPGPTGAPGANGAAGTDGQAGKDGATGPQGSAGKDGANGADGSPPASYTIVSPIDGLSYRCDRDSGSPDTAPTYTCSAAGSAPG